MQESSYRHLLNKKYAKQTARHIKIRLGKKQLVYPALTTSMKL